ncbi:MAG: hypothetical protein R2793_06800 [Flavobacteriaceae bacterium]
MSFQTLYHPLLHLNVYHHYFLDDGTVAFDSSTTLKTQQLSSYDYQSFLKIIPSEGTQQKLRGQKIRVRNTNSGVTLYVNVEETAPNVFTPKVPLSQTESLTFLVYITDLLFENYSTVAAQPAIPYFFSNKKPVTEGGGFTYIDLEATTHPVEDYSILQTTYDPFLTQLSTKEKLGLFAILQLEMAGDDTTVFDGNARRVLNTNGTVQDPAPIYKIQMENRNTIWNYINPEDNSLIHSTDPTELPLVKRGIIGYSFGGKERPSAEPYRLVFEKDGGGNIIKTISEIFIN